MSGGGGVGELRSLSGLCPDGIALETGGEALCIIHRLFVALYTYWFYLHLWFHIVFSHWLFNYFTWFTFTCIFMALPSRLHCNSLVTVLTLCLLLCNLSDFYS